MKFVSRGGEKLNYALNKFNLDVKGKICADLGSSTGGFVDCLIKKGARKVYSIDTCYGELDWGLRKNPKVIVMERTNALHVQLPEAVDFVSIDVGWTRQEDIIRKAYDIAKDGGDIVSLVKPQYELKSERDRKQIALEKSKEIFNNVRNNLNDNGFKIVDFIESPIKGRRGGNTEYLIWLKKNK